uniref:Uncharacterized protein LOC111109697 isoform X2 n=1 Tax=Crassostrea virginica TaxID=6565 RepID=A0A8B8BE06_CRAVI|nr:uncharacterized protein LOC111109697 isoform X2 [Crassostrea virginica]
MDSFYERRKCCRCSVKQWIFSVLLVFVLVLGLAILISSAIFLHSPDDNQSSQCVGPLKQTRNQTKSAGNSSKFIHAKSPAVGDPCSDINSCPENSVCDSGQCSCNVTSYQEYNGECLKVSNLALGKAVFGSSNFYHWYVGEGWENAVDGLTNVREWKKLFHTAYELYPWLSIALGRLALVRSVTVYNRVDNYGRWLHDVEARVGNSSDWTKLSLCGTFVGPSDTGQVHVIECGELLSGTIVTVKIVQPNYIKDNPAARGGMNCLVLEEVTVEGVFL